MFSELFDFVLWEELQPRVVSDVSPWVLHILIWPFLPFFNANFLVSWGNVGGHQLSGHATGFQWDLRPGFDSALPKTQSFVFSSHSFVDFVPCTDAISCWNLFFFILNADVWLTRTDCPQQNAYIWLHFCCLSISSCFKATHDATTTVLHHMNGVSFVLGCLNIMPGLNFPKALRFFIQIFIL